MNPVKKPWTKAWLDEFSEMERRPCKVHWIVIMAMVATAALLTLWCTVDPHYVDNTGGTHDHYGE